MSGGGAWLIGCLGGRKNKHPSPPPSLCSGLGNKGVMEQRAPRFPPSAFQTVLHTVALTRDPLHVLLRDPPRVPPRVQSPVPPRVPSRVPPRFRPVLRLLVFHRVFHRVFHPVLHLVLHPVPPRVGGCPPYEMIMEGIRILLSQAKGGSSNQRIPHAVIASTLTYDESSTWSMWLLDLAVQVLTFHSKFSIFRRQTFRAATAVRAS